MVVLYEMIIIDELRVDFVRHVDRCTNLIVRE